MRSYSARRSAVLFAGLVAAGALVLTSAPAATGEPTTSSEEATPTATTSSSPTPTETESASSTPTATSETTRPRRTRTPDPVTTSAEPTTTSASPTTSAEPTEEADEKAEQAEPGGLTVWTGPLGLNGAPQPGTLVSGQMSVQIEDTRPVSTGWNVDVKTTDARGSGGGSFTPGPDSYYRATDTACSTSTGTVPFTASATTVATSNQKCADARWTSDVGIEVPMDVAPDNYSLTITHSVY